MDPSDQLLKMFLDEGRENIDLLDREIINLETDPENTELLDEIFRGFHTLKGQCRRPKYKNVRKVCSHC